jgi:hypothetical protein
MPAPLETPVANVRWLRQIVCWRCVIRAPRNATSSTPEPDAVTFHTGPTALGYTATKWFPSAVREKPL